jgi:ribosome maturation factor RimP
MKPTILEHMEQLVTPFLQENQFELVEIEYVKEAGNYFLRLYVDKEGGIDIDECARVSEYLSSKLDENDPIEEAYFLEVSSPGAERPLKKPADFVKAVGKYVYMETRDPMPGGLQKFEGTLLANDDTQVTIKVGKKEHQIAKANLKLARLAIKF